jgi:cellulose synthase/poly-beta-1,6-N-acetylglucosamine synthase-like glycosyltransferase
VAAGGLDIELSKPDEGDESGKSRMSNNKEHNVFAVVAATVVVCALMSVAGCVDPGAKYYNTEAELPAAADSASLALNDEDWVEVINWDFADGYFPGGWGWGDWNINDGLLSGRDETGNIAVYFFPFDHGDDALLETRVRFVHSEPDHNVEAQLLTRDSDFIHYESGLVLFAGQDSVNVRHMASTRDYVRDIAPTETDVEHGAWYVMRFMFRDGEVHAFVGDEHVYSSVLAAASAREAGAMDADTLGSFPLGEYREPHLAVKWGEAEFEYVRFYETTSARALTIASAAGADGKIRQRQSAASRRAQSDKHWLVQLMLWLLYTVIFIVCIYLIRHYAFTVNRLFGRQRQPYLDIDTADWPEVTVVIPAHNEEKVIGEILEALLEVDYPRDRMTIMPVNDRSKDKTGEIIDDFTKENPDIFKPFHRKKGMGGKAAALRDATTRIETDIMLVFDADYIPGRGLIKQLVAPFFDPEVGAVMGRVVPYNVDSNLLTRLLDLERAGGYQVDQQARMNMKLVPQYGGTVGGVRKTALLSVGNWRVDSLAEDTDLTYRLLVNGWKTVYQNRSECYEQVPETWTSRLRQIMRWAKGHNQATARYSIKLIRNKRTSWVEKLDGFLLLGVYLMSPILIFGWSLGIVLWYLGEPKAGLIIILLVTSYSTLGNFAVFFEIAAATHLDGSRGRIKLLPFVFLGFLVSLFSITRAAFAHIAVNGNGKNGKKERVVWDKTERNGNFNGHTNGNGKNGYHFNGNGKNSKNNQNGREEK